MRSEAFHPSPHKVLSYTAQALGIGCEAAFKKYATVSRSASDSNRQVIHTTDSEQMPYVSSACGGLLMMM